MKPSRIFDELSARLSELAETTPARDLEKNARAVLSSTFERLDLVTREEFEVQQEMLLHARERLEQLEERVAELEAQQCARDKG